MLLINRTTTSYELLQVVGKSLADESFKSKTVFSRFGKTIEFNDLLKEILDSGEITVEGLIKLATP